jgi:hypothetical protein
MWWLGLTTGTVLVAALILRRILARTSTSTSSASSLEVGSVSENWLAEQRGRKD